MKGGAETVFQITRKIPGIQNFTGYVRLDNSSYSPDISFHDWENDNKLTGILNYIFSFRNYGLLQDFLARTEIDVIHLHGFFSSLSPSILLAIKQAKRRRKIKVVQTLHDFHLVCPNSSLYNFNENKICEKCIGKKFKFSIFIENCDRRGFIHSIIKGKRSFVSNNFLGHRKIVDTFICPSEFLKSKLIEDRVDENKITIIRNPVTIINFNQRFEKQNVICYFGRFSKEKNLKFLIDAFSCWKEKTKNNFRLLLIGAGEEESRIKEFAAKTTAKDSIIFKSYMPLEKLIEEIKYAKYFSMATMCYENAPMSVIESLALDIIPIIPNIGGMKESIQLISKVGKTYQPDNKESWISAMDKLERNYDNEKEILLKSKKELLKELRMQNYFNKIISVYST
ncbi:MAG: glycosyltransferase [Bacteroidetes bacterium]|nr:glycosyltransferase [Bacteroidota bacterium]